MYVFKSDRGDVFFALKLIDRHFSAESGCNDSINDSNAKSFLATPAKKK